MSRCLFLIFSLALAIVAAASPKPIYNVLFVSIDDLRVELGAYDDRHIISPNLDRLAEDGMVFNRAYCQLAVCTPSRASIFTGKRPETLNVIHLRDNFRELNPRIITLPLLLRSNGYLTQTLGKTIAPGDPISWDPPLFPNPYPYPPELCGAARKYASEEIVSAVQAEYDAAVAAGLTGVTFERAARGPVIEFAEVEDEAYHDGRLAATAIGTLRKLKKAGKPFFFALGFFKPHLPFAAPKKYWDLYDDIELPPLENNYLPFKSPWYAIGRNSEFRGYDGSPDGTVPYEQAMAYRRAYYACISYVDAQLGKVLAELDALGLADNTIVVVWGDHGFKLGENAGWGKSSNVENDIRVPLILRVPGKADSGKRSHALVELVDLYPTLIDLIGLEAPHEMEGTSLVPLFDKPNRNWKKAAFSVYPRSLNLDELERNAWDVLGKTIRTDRYRYTEWESVSHRGRIEDIELYDHRNDPQENRNVARDPEYRAIVKTLSQQLAVGWRAARPN